MPSILINSLGEQIESFLALVLGEPAALLFPRLNCKRQALVVAEIHKVIQTLPGEEPEVIKLLFGLEDGTSKTIEECSRRLGLDEALVQDLKNSAIRRLQNARRKIALEKKFELTTPGCVYEL